MRMPDDDLYEKLDEAIRKQAEIPAEERIADMIARGVIDKNGRVLLKGRIPQPPRKPRKATDASSVGPNGSPKKT